MVDKNTSKAGVVLGGTALVAAAIALFKDRAVKASPEGVITLDEATINLLIAMAQTSADLEALVNQILQTLEGQEEGITLQVQGYPDNTETIIATRVQIPAAVAPNNWLQLPDIAVPYGMALQLKGWPTNAGIIYVGRSRATATNINQIWPLLANEAVGYFVKNANAIYISGTVAGDWLAITVEQRGRAG